MKRVLEWQDDAACAQVATDMFFPEVGGSNRDAQSICAGCPVRAQCLELGLDEDFGIWGGLSTLQRKRMRKTAA